MGALISFFTGPLGKIAMYAIGALLAAGILWAAVAHYDNLVEQAAVLRQVNAQLTQSIADKDKEIQDTKDLLALQGTSIDSLQQNIDEISRKYGTLADYLKSKEAQEANRPSSAILKETVRRLKEIEK